MNAYDRYLNALSGKPVDKTPNFDILMGFAPRFIGRPLRSYYLDYQVLVEANLAMVEHFGLDIVQAISDSYREAHDFGSVVEFPPDDMPIVKQPLLADEARISSLRPLDPCVGRRMSDRLEAIRSFSEKVKGQVPIMGWIEGALAESADLRGVGRLLLDLYDRPGWLGDVFEICTQTAISFGLAQVEAGADIIGMGDSIASQISPKMYREFGLPYEKRIIEAIHRAGARVRLHICGDITRIFPAVVESGADIIDVDHMVDLGYARKVAGESAALTGNFDPVSVMLQASDQEVARRVRECMELGGARYMSAAGCEIPIGTPHANLLAQERVLYSAGGPADAPLGTGAG